MPQLVMLQGLDMACHKIKTRCQDRMHMDIQSLPGCIHGTVPQRWQNSVQTGPLPTSMVTSISMYVEPQSRHRTQPPACNFSKRPAHSSTAVGGKGLKGRTRGGCKGRGCLHWVQ